MPTFGYTSPGGSGAGGTANQLRGVKLTAPATGVVTGISLYCRDVEAGQFRAVVVDNATKAIVANGISNAVAAGTSLGYVEATFPTPPSITSGVEYLFCVIFGENFTQINFASGSANQGFSDNSNSFASPSNPNDGSGNSTQYSIFVTYTTGGGDQTISPSGIASGEAFGSATVTAGAVTISPSGIASGEAFGTAALTAGAVTVSPSGIASAEAFGTAVVTAGTVTVSPSGIASAEAFGTATVTAGAVTILPTGIPSGEAFGLAVLTPGAVTISPAGIASAEAFGTATVSLANSQTISPTGIPSAEAFGTPTVNGRRRSLLRTIQQDLTDRLAADPFFDDLIVISRRPKDIINEVEQQVAKVGAAALVLITRADVITPNVPGPYFGEIKIEVGCCENRIVNKTGKEAELIAETVCSLLHHYTPQPLSCPVLCDIPTIAEIPPRTEDDQDKRLLGVSFRAQGGISYPVPQLAPVTYSADTGEISLACATPGAAIFYRLDGKHPNPRESTLYTAPFTPAPGSKISARAWLMGFRASDVLKITA